ncbi:hypothetical protein [Chlamydiifrater phoenicopteri]|uniref:hypothetical protein n=1 Tax=Chlamydiifrater phoenicopteri TaxID=2681469 RepID=UPI001BCB0341|nr:hypothetical protein [Chlamydiifrater phoenicopteri]
MPWSHWIIIVSILLSNPSSLLASSRTAHTTSSGIKQGSKIKASSGAILNGEFKEVLERKSLQEQLAFFQTFLDVVKEPGAKFSVQEFVTAASLSKILASSLVKEGESDKAVEVIKNTLRIPGLPKQARTELMAYLQTLNPEKLPLPQLVDKLFGLPQEVQDKMSWQDSLLMNVCKLALLGDYTNRKYEVEQAFSSERYSECSMLAKNLFEDISTGKVYLDPHLLKLEKYFLLRIDETSKFFLAKKEGKTSRELMGLISKVCLKEKNYADALSCLLELIAKGEVARSWEVDRILFSDALNRSVSSLREAVQELEVLIDRGRYLSGSIACNGYFKLLEWYLKSCEQARLDSLLEAGEKEFFKEDSPYYSSYLFFLGARAYRQGLFAEAVSILEEGLKNSPNSSCFLSDIWECLGCSLLKQAMNIACETTRKQMYSRAEVFFLKAYKNWARTESGVAWFLCKALRGDQHSCFDFMRKEAQKMPFKEKNMILSLYGLFFSSPEELHLYPFSLRKEKNIKAFLQNRFSVEEMTLYEEIFASLLNLMPFSFDLEQREDLEVVKNLLDLNVSNKRPKEDFCARTSLLSNEIFSIVEEVVAFENTEKLDKSLQKNSWDKTSREALKVLVAVRKGNSFNVEGFDNKFLSMASQCFAACTQGRKVFFDEKFFLEASPLLRSYFLSIVSRIPNCFNLDFPRLFETLGKVEIAYGDRLFFLLQPYFLGCGSLEDIYLKAQHFSQKFPSSALASIAYYLSSLGRTSLEEKEKDLRAAASNLVNLPHGLGREAERAYIRFTIRRALVETLMEKCSPASLIDATIVLEELKEEFFSSTHPITGCWRMDNPTTFYKAGNQIGLLLAKCYALRNEEDALIDHLVESMENNLLSESRCGKHFDGTLAASLQLGEVFIANYGSVFPQESFS